jgi:alpha-2-macroglobulin
MTSKSRIFPALMALFISLALACNFSVPLELPAIIQATPTATPLTLPPAIVETDPPAGSRIGLQQGVAFFFNQPMQRESVEAALKLDGKDGLYTWIDDSTLTFTPRQPLPADSTVTFTLTTGATAANGLPLLEDQFLTFTTVPTLAVAQTLPAADATDIRTDSAVVLTFNQPVVPLGADSADLPAAFSLEPATSGRGEWLNTSTYIFYPEPALQGGADYTARVNPSLPGLGAENAVSWSFSTSLPRVVEAVPYEDEPLGLEPEIAVTFNQPMDRASVEADLRLEGPSGRADGKLEWNESGTQMVFKPAGRLLRAASYRLRLSSESRSLNGQPLQAGIQRDYVTYPEFGVVFSEPFDGGTKAYNGNLLINLTAPLKDYGYEELEQVVTVSPSVGNLWLSSYGGTELNVYGDFAPDTLYTVTISPDLQDRWGARLGTTFSTRLRSEPPPPGLSLPHHPAVLVMPDDPRLAVQATNLSLLDVSVGAISAADFFRLNRDYQARENFQPTGERSWRETTDTGMGTRAYGVSLSQSGSLTPGLYFARITSPQEQTFFAKSPLFVLASNVNLTLKVAADGVLAWAVDTRSGVPVAGQEIALYDWEGSLVASGQTDSDGLWRQSFQNRLSIDDSYYALLGQPGDEHFSVASTDFNLGVAPWDFGLPALYYSDGNEKVYLYTDRPIYRPGDQVFFRGVAREVYNGRYSDLAQARPWTAILFDYAGREIESAPVTFSEYGGFSGQFRLPEGAVPGGWSVAIKSNPGRWGDNYHTIYFDVADYRKPEIDLSVTLSPQNALAGQTLQAQIQADYFFGAPVNDLPFEWKLYREREYFSIPGFQSGLYSALWLGEWRDYFWGEVASGAARTGVGGTFTLDLDDLEIENIARFTLEVTALESGGYPLSARDSAIVHPGAAYPGIRPAQWVGRAGEPLSFTLTAVGIDGDPLAGKTLQLELATVTWTLRPGDEANPYPRYDRQTETIERGQAVTDSSGLAESRFTPSDPGTYLLRAEVDGNASEAMIWVGGMGQAIWPAAPFDQLRLTADQSDYQPGQMASVFIPNPFNAPARALVTTERGAILSARIVQVAAGGVSVDIPLTDEEAPNVFVSVTLLGPGTDFRMGYLNIEVEPVNFVLNVDLQVTPEKAAPGQEVRFDLRVTDSKDQPVQGEFSLAVVDLAVLALADPNAPDIVPAFYDIQPLAVRSGLTNAVVSQRLFPMGNGMGGGGGELAMSIREDFPDTALWTTFVTDSDGKAQISLTLPDSLTTWQVDTRGLDRQTRVGGARINLVTSKDLLLRPITPRYLVVGDRARVSTYVNNNTASPLEAEVTLKASGAILEDEKTATQNVSVPANGRTLVSWWLRAGEAASADFVFSVSAGNLTDSTRPVDGSIPILGYTAPQAFVTAGVLPSAGTRTEIVSLPRSFTPLGGDLTLELSPSLGAYLLNAAESLPEPDEFSSNETIASYLIANLAIVPALREAGVPAVELTGREAAIQSWADRLAARQNNDGGWNWYRRGDWGEVPSDPIVSAHVTYALGLVEQAGESRLEFTLQNAKQYLASQMVFDFTTPNIDLDEQAFIQLAYYGTPTGQAMGSLETASLVAAPSRLPVDELFELRERLSPLGQAYLALAYLGMDSPQPARVLLSNLAVTANRTASGAFWDNPGLGWRSPGSPVYTTAVVVHAFGLADPASPILNDAVRYLAANRSAARDWGGSLQNAWVLRALSSALVGAGEFTANFPFDVRLNGVEIARGQAASPQSLTTVTNVTPLDRLHPNAPNELLLTRQAGNGKLYYRATLNVLRPAESAPALDRGIAVSREYLDCRADPCGPVTSWQLTPETVGKVTVRVTVNLPHDMYYLNVEDYAPAGAEIVNPILKTSQQGDKALDVEYFSPDTPYADGWGWWYFDSPRIYRDRIQWTADYLPAGTYVLTYTLIPSLPGEYRVLPAHAWMTFFPEVQGTSAGSLFEIRD